jgi:hypothetical protein
LPEAGPGRSGSYGRGGQATLLQRGSQLADHAVHRLHRLDPVDVLSVDLGELFTSELAIATQPARFAGHVALVERRSARRPQLQEPVGVARRRGRGRCGVNDAISSRKGACSAADRSMKAVPLADSTSDAFVPARVHRAFDRRGGRSGKGVDWADGSQDHHYHGTIRMINVVG